MVKVDKLFQLGFLIPIECGDAWFISLVGEFPGPVNMQSNLEFLSLALPLPMDFTF